MVVTVRGDRFVQPGGIAAGQISTLSNRPLTFAQQLEQAKSGIFINPQTGVAAFTASLDDADRKRKVRQDLAFATAIGGQLQQLGIEAPGTEGSGFLRPEQIGQLLALRRGDDPVRVLSGLGGSPIKGFADMPSQSLGTSAFGATGSTLSFAGGSPLFDGTESSGELPPAESNRGGLSPQLLLGGAAAIAALLLVLRKG